MKNGSFPLRMMANKNTIFLGSEIQLH